MNKQWKLLIGTLLSLLMYSCSVVDEEQNDVVNIKDASELYGTWEYESSSLITGYLGDNTTPHYYVLSKDTAIFIQKLSSSDKKALFKINKIQWSLNDSITITLKPDLRELQGYEYSWDYKTIKPSISVKGFDTVWAYAYSDLDSVIHHNNINNTTKLTDQSFVIIKDTSKNRGKNQS